MKTSLWNAFAFVYLSQVTEFHLSLQSINHPACSHSLLSPPLQRRVHWRTTGKELRPASPVPGGPVASRPHTAGLSKPRCPMTSAAARSTCTARRPPSKTIPCSKKPVHTSTGMYIVDIACSPAALTPPTLLPSSAIRYYPMLIYPSALSALP